ncbi:HAD family hydrolase [Halobacterium bonnevillei]|uniref:HAD-IA family hydrolase n=1 Tax=Halobacterium bonnevillei TaxID=2692200 RepID=A0A6B0SM51_9EURY|nr:HAD family hydrolase [Halobacterium bonnevillei]MXR22327.1 HAD-IA family hydrolase [Halobacterium bonnevillei]
MRAIWFDLDGTLLHMERDIGDAIAAAFEDVAGDAPDAWVSAYNEGFLERFPDCEPEPYRHGARYATETTDFDGGVEELRDALLRAEVESLAPTPDAADVLGTLADSEHYRVGVLTNGHPEWQREKLAAHGLDQYVDAVVASYEVGHHKPHPAPFERAADRLEAGAYGMVGDSDADVDGAANVGWAATRYEGGTLGDVPAALGWE